jgi:cysteine-S-conjugate beta-lyase
MDNLRLKMEYESLLIHGGKADEGKTRAVNVPIYLSSTFIQPEYDKFQEYEYTRGGNPTRSAVEKLAADLEGTKHGLALASGMAASALVFGLLQKGDKVLLNNNVYGGTYRFVSNIFADRGLEYELIDDFNTYDLAQADKNVKAVFIETPSNPLLDVTDIARLAKQAKQKGILVIVDNTFLTSYYQKPLDLGADIVVYSATKFYSGHSDVLAGLVVLNDDELYKKLKFLQNTLGGILSATDSFLLIRGIRTLSVRLDRHQENALKAADFLYHNKAVQDVYYPGLPSHPGYEIQKKQSSGFGAVLSIRLKEKYDTKVFVDSLKMFSLAVSLGGVESLICHPATMTHESYPKKLQKKLGIDDKLIRLSVGIENGNDLIDDLKNALSKAKI